MAEAQPVPDPGKSPEPDGENHHDARNAPAALVLQLIGARMARGRPHWHLKTAFPALADAVKNGTLDDSALGALVLAVLAGLFLGIRGRKH
jgi:hypothetical protein